MSSSNDQFCIPLSQRSTSGLSEMTSSDQKSCTEGAALSFHNICYRVKMKSGFLLGKKTVEKEILLNISGIMRPGLNAILGPPGAGKSVLLDVLAARKHPETFSGDVLINGEPQSANFKCHSGYVAQDDVVMGTLTVRENLHFSAALRLPTTMTNHEKTEKINEVIEELGLGKVADSKVGTEQIHGVSRAERKKTSIAMELVTDPSILFLDEPTSALDSSTAHTIFLLLKRMSKQGRTIIFSIRQSQYSIFKVFDSLTLLAAGKLIFHGPAQMAVEYFASAGYNCGPYANPAVLLLDVIGGVFTAVESDREEEDHECEKTEEFFMRDEPGIENLAEIYANSSFYRDTKAELDRLSDVSLKPLLVDGSSETFQPKNQGGACAVSPGASAQTEQVKDVSTGSSGSRVDRRPHRPSLLKYRTVHVQWHRDRDVSSAHKFQSCRLYFVPTRTPPGARIARLLFMAFMSAAPELCPDLASPRQRRSTVSEESVLTQTPRTGQGFEDSVDDSGRGSAMREDHRLKPAVEAFFIMVLTLLMVSCSADSVALGMTVGQSVLLSIVTLLINDYFRVIQTFWIMTVLFGTTGSQLLWLQYISIPYYGLMALQHNELLGQNFCPGLNETAGNGCPSYVTCTGEEFLTGLGQFSSSQSVYQNLLRNFAETHVWILPHPTAELPP
ncbi:broad substrate specificity ATP-binding cassette transporter ABCG2-like [Erethizon dorsatum]